jgi:hypothetical protein
LQASSFFQDNNPFILNLCITINDFCAQNLVAQELDLTLEGEVMEVHLFSEIIN